MFFSYQHDELMTELHLQHLQHLRPRADPRQHSRATAAMNPEVDNMTVSRDTTVRFSCAFTPSHDLY